MIAYSKYDNMLLTVNTTILSDAKPRKLHRIITDTQQNDVVIHIKRKLLFMKHLNFLQLNTKPTQ